MFGRGKPRIATARAVTAPPARGKAARSVSPIVTLAVCFGRARTQLAWLAVSLTAMIALYFVTKIEVPKSGPFDAVAASSEVRNGSAQFLTGDLFGFSTADDARARTRRWQRMIDDLAAIPERRSPDVPASYQPGEGLVGIALPIAALIVALLLSWERKARRLLREGRDVVAEIYEVHRPHGGFTGDARVVDVYFVLPGVVGGPAERTVTAIRPPGMIGELETVIYDPLYPDRAIALADLPGRPHIDATRNTLRATTIPLLHFVLPATALGLLVTLAVSVPLAL